MIRKFWNWYSSFFNDFYSPQGRDFAIAAYVMLVFISTHLLYFFLYSFWQVWPMVIFSIFGGVFFVGVAFIILRLRHIVLGNFLLELHTVIGLSLQIYFIGWDFGAHYVLLSGLVFTFIARSYYSTKMKIFSAIFAITLFIAFYYYTKLAPPVYTVPPLQLAIVNVVNIFAVFIGMCFGLYLAVYLINRAETALVIEHQKNEALLDNVFPAEIANRLKTEDGTIADDFANASILFADLAGFTPFSASLSPAKLVDMLDTIFSRFDELVDKYGLEKIKTIGDEYMVASGIPTPREDHAEALAYFALAMRDSLTEFNQQHNTNLQIRIGLNSGPVIAGVIGKRHFLYDLWGDSVNTASRMESHGVPGEIQVTEATRQLLDGKFAFTYRGIIDVKGKGPMQAYFLQANGIVPAPG